MKTASWINHLIVAHEKITAHVYVIRSRDWGYGNIEYRVYRHDINDDGTVNEVALLIFDTLSDAVAYVDYWNRLFLRDFPDDGQTAGGGGCCSLPAADAGNCCKLSGYVGELETKLSTALDEQSAMGDIIQRLLDHIELLLTSKGL